jgi:hypothetical protein
MNAFFRSLSVVLVLSGAACGTGAPDEDGADETPAPLAPSLASSRPVARDVDAVPGPQDPSVRGDPTELALCLEYAALSGEVWGAYCGAFPIPQIRALCYAAALASYAARAGFCYARWAD